MELQAGIFQLHPADYARVVEVWEASVRATHDFVSAADIEIFRAIVASVLPEIPLAGMRDSDGAVVGFVGVVHGKIEMLFIHPDWRGRGVGRQLLRYAIDELGATELDVNEQNPQAVGFYLHMGLEIIGRSELDGMGKPYPLLHLRVRE